MAIAFVKPADIKDSLTGNAEREIHELPQTEEELQELIKNAEAGDPCAQCLLGYYYRALAEDKLAYFREHILSGSPNMRAPYNISESLPFFEVAEEERKNAFIWFQRAAEQGNAEALYELSVCYRHGVGTAQHHDKAQELLLQAANKGYAPAQYDVGMQFYFGKTDTYRDLNPDLKRKPDYVQAVGWLKKAAEQGVGLAEYHLGLCYEEGTGIEKDEKAAFRLYQKAAEGELVWAMIKLGECYENGRGTAKDIRQAIKHYQAAADSGYEEAYDALERLEKEE